jgi:aspartyl-tRNA synthetase
MIGGLEKYFQIARCFRDEDARADRQAEFTQIDMEMSFVTQEDVLDVVERMFACVMKVVMNVNVTTPFPRMTFAEAMRRFGSDKPDTRFGMELTDITDIAATSEFRVFRDTIAKGGHVKAIVATGCASYSRKEVDDLTEIAKRFGAKGLATWSLGESEIKSAIAKFFSREQMDAIFERCGAAPGDLVLAVADQPAVVAEALNRLRLELGNRLGLIPAGVYDFRWIVDFPLVEWNEQERRYDPKHHPFCMPNPEDLSLLGTGFDESDVGSPDHPHTRLRAWAYDVVLNGVELGSGSIRCHRRDIQEQIFKLIGLTPEQAQRRFGFLLEAFELGAPPHGGIAPGVDRFVAILAGVYPNIRDVIAFPKTANTTDLMTGAPTEIDPETLASLNLRVVLPNG